tara:strand:+ start:4911 stop:5357 length:447 start_codon:yes stop_codon:yes gene_type:complete
VNAVDQSSWNNLFLGSETDTQAPFAPLNSKHNSELRRSWVADADQISRFAINDRQKSTLGVHKRQKGHNASSLDSVGQITLLFGGEACKTTGQNFASLSDEFLQQIHILVVDGIARFDRRKALLEKGAGHESETIGKLDERQTHLISL